MDAGVFLVLLLLPCGAFAGGSTFDAGVHSMLSVFSTVFAVLDLSE